MKNFKEFREDFKDELFSSGTADLFAYAAYCQGFAEGMKENLNNMLPAPITMSNVPAPHFPYDKITCDTEDK